MLAINKLLLSNPFVTSKEIKAKLNLVAATKTVRNYIHKLGWRKVNTKYCQIVSPVNRLKRYIYACFCKIYNETYDDILVIDETTVEIRLASMKPQSRFAWHHIKIGTRHLQELRVGKLRSQNTAISKYIFWAIY